MTWRRCGLMRRAVITGFASLLAVALIAPAAQGATQVRHFQGEMSTPLELGGAPTLVPFEDEGFPTGPRR